MDADYFNTILNLALDDLYVKDQFLLLPKYNVHERSVSALLARYIYDHIEDESIHVDVEYNRMRADYEEEPEVFIAKRLDLLQHGIDQENVMPDIIVHKRNEDKNYVIIEIKMAWKNKKKDFDHIKINAYMDQLGYQFGFYVELTEARGEVKIQQGQFEL